MPASRKGLVLKRTDLRRNTAALFERLDRDPAAREEFIRDPTGKLATHIARRRLPRQHLSDANRVLFAMLANDEFRAWLDRYRARPGGRPVTEATFGRDFAAAVLKYGDSELLRALFKMAGDGYGMPGVSHVFQQLVVGPEKSVITSPATPSTSDKSAHSSQNFNNKQTGIQLGDGAIVDPAMMRAITSQLIAHAKALKAAGKLVI
ncbi:MAG TPA: hypothetical protein VK922_03505 [Gemmatimonadaceae bacterium]|nr:hypothetical protein [Gemmatimonadaceae bacterium]